MADSPETIGEAIKRLRLRAGLTQKELAEKCGTVGSAIRKYESGKITPKIETLQRIAAALGVSVFAIYDAANPMINAMKALETANEIGNRLYDRQNQDIYISKNERISSQEIYNSSKEIEHILGGIFNNNGEYNSCTEFDSAIQRLKANTSNIDLQLLILYFEKLNPAGQEKAVERVEELTEIPKYQREPENSAKKEPPPAANRKRPTEE